MDTIKSNVPNSDDKAWWDSAV